MHSLKPYIMEYGLSKTEIVVLMRVYHHGSNRVSDLAKMADVPASTFTGVIDRLVQKKYLVRINDPEDRRSVLVQGTQELQDTIGKMMEKFNANLAEILEPVPVGLVQETTDNLCRIYEIVTTKSGIDAGKTDCEI